VAGMMYRLSISLPSCCRFGVWADWEAPYLTLDSKYEAAQLRVFAKMVANGHIYRGRKPVHWSPSSQTALAESVLPPLPHPTSDISTLLSALQTLEPQPCPCQNLSSPSPTPEFFVQPPNLRPPTRELITTNSSPSVA